MTLDEDEARTRFGSVALVHLATADREGQPHLVATTFALLGDRIVMAVDHKPKRTRNLKRLRNIQDNPKVSVLADYYDPDDWSKLWWARADGTAQVIENPADMREAVDRLVERYQQYREIRPEGPVIEVSVQRWSGWSGER